MCRWELVCSNPRLCEVDSQAIPFKKLCNKCSTSVDVAIVTCSICVEKTKDMFPQIALQDARDRLRDSYTRENNKMRQIFDLRNQNKRFRDAIAQVVVDIDVDSGYFSLRDDMNKILRAEENLL